MQRGKSSNLLHISNCGKLGEVFIFSSPILTAAQRLRNLPGDLRPTPRLARIFGRTLTQAGAQRQQDQS